MPKPKAKDKPSTRAPVGDGMLKKAKEWLMGRSGKVDAKVEGAQKGGAAKKKKAEMPMEPKKKKAIEDAVQEAKDREMDKNMNKGYNKAKKAPLW